MNRYYRFTDLVDARIVKNRQTLSQWIKRYGFPRPVHLGPNTAAWPAEEVEAWLRQRAAERDEADAAATRPVVTISGTCATATARVEEDQTVRSGKPAPRRPGAVG